MRVSCTVDEHFLHLLVLQWHVFRFMELVKGRNRSFPSCSQPREDQEITFFLCKVDVHIMEVVLILKGLVLGIRFTEHINYVTYLLIFYTSFHLSVTLIYRLYSLLLLNFLLLHSMSLMIIEILFHFVDNP